MRLPPFGTLSIDAGPRKLNLRVAFGLTSASGRSNRQQREANRDVDEDFVTRKRSASIR
jgi:hypothetical protein